jgi:hypothetical protein
MTSLLLNEPTAALRALAVRLLDTGGAGLPANHSWIAGEVKVRRPGASSFVNSVNLPTAVTGGAAGSFDLAIDLAEVAAEGIGRVQFSPSGGAFAEFIYEVRAHALDLVIDPLAAVGGGHTARECLNLAAAYSAGDAVGLDGPVGSISSLASDPAQRIHRIEFTCQAGKRTVTARQGS